jgi:aspartate kinase
MLNLKPIVMKFGGTSVEDAAAFNRVAELVATSDFPPVVVVSAMRGMTDALIASVHQARAGDLKVESKSLASQFARHADVAQTLPADGRAPTMQAIEAAREEIEHLLASILIDGEKTAAAADAVLSFGEWLSSILLAAILRQRGLAARQVDARQCIITDGEHGCATPLMDETFRRSREIIGPLLRQRLVPVLGGFVGATLSGETTTLGRGGSDYTAALVGAALEASEIQIWTDVTGVLTADPRVVGTARTIPRLSYAEAAELAYFGAKVLHPKTIQPAVESNIPVRICNSRLMENAGTVVCAESETTEHTVKAIAHKSGVTTVQISSARMLGAYGFLRAIFEVFDRHRTIVDVVTTSEVSVSLSLDDATALPAIVEELSQFGTVRVERDRAIICVVGEGLRGTPGIAARVFSTISDINVTLISQGASSINLTFAIEEAQVVEAVTRLHKAFFGEANDARPAFTAAAG